MTKRTSQSWEPVAIVRDWMIAAGVSIAAHPTLDVPQDAQHMTCALIEEEAAELRAAVEANDLVEVADAVADLLWVVLEAGLTFGIPVEPVFTEVARSNFTKVASGQLTVNEAGKIVKGPGYSAPALLPILAAHAPGTTDKDR